MLKRSTTVAPMVLCLESLLALLLCGSGAAWAQPAVAPAIFASGVVNAASFMAPPATGSGLAQGSLVSIFGSNLGPDPGVSAEYPLATELAGVSVEIHATDGRVLAAIPLFVSSRQINALLPSETPVGLNQVAVRRDGLTSGLAPVKVVHSSFGLFASGSGPVRTAVAQRFVSESELPVATPEAPARPGGTVVLWGTGLGPIAGSETEDPQAEPLDTPIEVLVGHRGAEITFQGRTSCCVGLDQINIRIPPDTPTGRFVPVWVSVRGSMFSNVASLPITGDGEPCRESPLLANPLPAAPIGRVLLQRSIELDDSLSPIEATTRDVAVGRFGKLPEVAAEAGAQTAALEQSARNVGLAPLQAADLAVLPPEGTCLVYESATGEGIFFRDAFFLDAGAQLELDGPLGRIDVPLAERQYLVQAPPAGLFLGAGNYHLEGPGGSEFPPFSAEVFGGEPVAWTERGDAEGEARLRGVPLAWEPADTSPESILVVGRAGAAVVDDADIAAPTRFVCAVSSDEHGFLVPPAVLANLIEATAGLELTSLWDPRPLAFATDGPETGAFAYLHAQQSSVRLGQARLPSTPVSLPGGTEVQAELAATFGERQRGLMFRRELPAEQGMLFLFENPGRYGFWMLNTLVPLDIIWLDADRQVVFVSENTPPCPAGTLCPTYGSEVVAQFVLELAAGQAAERGLALGDRLDW